jgi:uncharacterized membrane protein
MFSFGINICALILSPFKISCWKSVGRRFLRPCCSIYASIVFLVVFQTFPYLIPSIVPFLDCRLRYSAEYGVNFANSESVKRVIFSS